MPRKPKATEETLSTKLPSPPAASAPTQRRDFGNSPNRKKAVRPTPARTKPKPRRFSGETLIVVSIVGALALLGLGWAVVGTMVGQAPPASRVASENQVPPSGRSFAVLSGVPAPFRRDVWWIMNMAGIVETCGDSKVWTVQERRTEGHRDPSEFIIFCRDIGFYIVQLDEGSGIRGAVGPFPTVEMAETSINEGGEFNWAERRPTGFNMK